MIRRCLLIAFGLLIACPSLFGQNLSSAGQGTNTSGLEIVNGRKYAADLEFYPIQVLAGVRKKWYPQILELQKSFGRRWGRTVIEVEIDRDGSLRKMKTIESAGDDSLRAAASEAISSSAPFAGLPNAYREKTLKLRMHFEYDVPTSVEAAICDGPNSGAHTAAYAIQHRGNDITPPKPTYSSDPEYSEEARRNKYMSFVLVAGTVDPQGSFTDLCVLQAAGAGLDERAIGAVKTWKFEPASLRGQPVAVRLNVEVSFRLY